MSGYPLPALDIAKPPDPMENFSKLVALKGQMQAQQAQAQEMEMRQQQLDDMRAGSAAMRQWDGKDMEQLPNLYIRHGASAQAVFGLRSGILDYQTKLATKSKTELENDKARNDVIAGHIDTIKNMPPEQQPIAFEAAKSDLVQRNYLDPKAAQNFSYQGPDQLDTLEKMYTAHSAQVEDALKTANTREKTTQAALNDIKLKLSQNSKPGDFDKAIDSVTGTGPANQNLNTRTKALVNFALSRGDVESANQAIKAAAEQVGAVEKETNPQVIQARTQQAVATAAGTEAMRAKMFPAALQGVAPQLVAPATAAFDKAGQEYAAAKSAADNMSEFLQQAKSGNKEAVRIVPLQGALEITTSQGVHRINKTEVEQFGSAGSAYDRLAGKIGGVISGKDIPNDVLDDMAALQQTVSANAQRLHENKVKTINASYGSRFTPMDFSQGGTGGQNGRAPQGYTRIRASDGSLHDIPNANLGAARQRDPGLQIVQQ